MKLITLSLFCASLMAAVDQEPFSIPQSDAPQLAERGEYAVGVRTLELVHKGQVDILHFDKDTRKAPLYDRPLTVEVWYPAALAKSNEKNVHYKGAMAGTSPQPDMPSEFEVPGRATRDAAPLAGRKFPLVIVSHGYPGNRYFLSYLTENLASKGYVVAAIDHTDSVFGAVRPFASTLLNRSNDQLFVLNSLEKGEGFLHGLIEEGNAAIVGYSMGGYGALISAGAGLSSASLLNKLVPGDYLADFNAGNAKYQAIDRGSVKAIVAIAPWGAQAPMNGWDAASLSEIRIPSLFIVGDHDDVAGFEDGPKRAMRQATRSERCLLVYENARHNTGGNPPPDIHLSYRGKQSFDEPVWRKDRIAAINQHFITAFLDLYLKHDQSRRAFLHPPTEKSNDGKWTVPLTTPDDGKFSTGKDEAGEPFWPGFQRRWALGLEMSCYGSGQAAQ